MIATELISQAHELAGGDFGGKVQISYSSNGLILYPPGALKDNIEQNSGLITLEVPGYVAYILQVGLTKFPGDSQKDQDRPHKLGPTTLVKFGNRTSYLLSETVQNVAKNISKPPAQTLVANAA